MSIVSLTDFRALMREVQSVELDAVLQQHLDAAEAEACNFVGYDLLTEFESAGEVPTVVKIAIMLLAQSIADALSPDESNLRRGRAESLLRPYRVETGIAA